MNPAVKLLKDSLSRRGLTVAGLCAIAEVSAAGLSNIMAGRNKGTFTWRRLHRHLTEVEQAIIVAHYGEVFARPSPRLPVSEPPPLPVSPSPCLSS